MHIIALSFQNTSFVAHVKGKVTAELLFSDVRFGSAILSDGKIYEEIVDDMSKELTKANVVLTASTKGTLTGIGFNLHFSQLDLGKKVVEPSATWCTQVMMCCVPKLEQYGYELVSTSDTTFYFGEKRPVLNELMNGA